MYQRASKQSVDVGYVVLICVRFDFIDYMRRLFLVAFLYQ
jgi:hypothetical protein